MTLDESISAVWAVRDIPPEDAEMEKVLAKVASITGVDAEVMRSRTRRQPVTYARQVAMWHMHRAGYSMPKIGRFFNRDHTTVLHACKRVQSKMEQVHAA